MSKLVLGIISTLLAVISWFIFWWLSIVAIIVGIAGVMAKVQITNDTSKSYDTAGKLLSIIGITLGGIGFIIYLISLVTLMLN